MANTAIRSLTYDERKAAEAAFRGDPIEVEWTTSAKEIYNKLSAAINKKNTPS